MPLTLNSESKNNCPKSKGPKPKKQGIFIQICYWNAFLQSEIYNGLPALAKSSVISGGALRSKISMLYLPVCNRSGHEGNCT
ncbi:hypothetical protein V6N13_139963 [Hibiscus sabdariffa]|uniref:Uncharacterized protein n=1 Tax=Hibiscus sabdariffa TaxID=183260 RepID=A0ABR2QBK2_9ROSI